MPDRTVTVRARFDVSGVVAGARAGALAVKGFAGEVGKASGRQRDAFDAVGASAVGMGGAMVAGFGLAVKATAEFDKEMSKVAAVSGATGKQLAALRQSAIDAGRATAFSATQAAQATGELAKAGISTADILGGALKGSLSLAAAGGLELADAATISAQAMNIFSLRGQDVTHIADLLAAGANKSAADVKQLGDAMRMGGQVAAQTGLKIEDTVGVLSAFADNALVGSDAGTSLKTMLQHLAAPANKTRALMQDLGLEVYDAQGNFIGLAGLATELQASLGGLTQEQRDAAMATIFGSDAVRGANVLYKLGAQGVMEYTHAVNDTGAAGRMAAQMMDNLSGDLEKLKGSLETALIQGGSSATGVLRGMTQAATGLVDGFSALPGPVQGTVTVLVGLTGVVTLLGGAMVIAVPKIQAYKTALAEAGPRTQAVGKGLSAVGNVLTGPWGLAMGAAVIGLGVFATRHAEAEQRAKELRDTLNQETGALTDNSNALVTNRLESDGVLKAAQQLKLNMGDVINAALGQGDAMDRVTTGLHAARDRAKELDAQYGDGIAAQNEYALNAQAVTSALDGSNTEIREQVESVKRQATATDQAAASSRNAAGPIGQVTREVAGLGGQADEAADALKDAKDALDAIFNPSIAAFKAATQLKSGYRELIGQLTAAKGKMDGNSEASIRLRQAFAGELETVADLYTARLDQTQSTEKATAAVRNQLPILYALAGGNKEARAQVDKLAEATGNVTGRTNISRDAFIKSARHMGIARDRAKELWQELAKIKSRKVDVQVTAKGTWSASGSSKLFGGGHSLAVGGPVPNAPLGPGGPTSDDVPLWGSVGEHMWTAREVAAAGGHGAVMRMRSAALRGDMRGYATGGPVVSLGGDSRGTSAVVGDVLRPLETGADALVGKIAGVYANAWKRFVASGGPVVSAGRSQLGLPYSWGGGGPNGPSYGIGRGAHIYGFDCSGLTQYAWHRGRGIDIGGTTYSQHPNSVGIGGPRPGALGFNSSLGHVVLGSSRPGYVIEAPHTGAYVREVKRSMPDWRWPKAAGMAAGGPVTPGEERLGERALYGNADRDAVRRARLLGLAGDPSGLNLKEYDQGGILPPGVTTAYNGTGRPEYVLTQQQIQAGYAGTAQPGFGSISLAFRAGQTSGPSDLAGAASDLKDASEALRDIVSLRDGLDKLTSSIFGQEKALSSYEAAWDSAKASLKENKRTLSIGTEAGRANRSALLGLAEAALDVVSAMRELGKPSSQIVAKMAEQRKEFIRMARAMGLTLAQARALADRYGLVPSKVKGILATEKRDTAYNKKIEAKVAGGAAGGWTLLGEEGPELAYLPGRSYVVPAARTRAMLAAGSRRAIPTSTGVGGGGAMSITLMVGDRTLTELVVDTARGYVRAHGGDVQATLGTRRR
jgi:TP901 family phage tail tape measure protein